MKSKLLKKAWVTDTCVLLLYCNEKGVLSLWIDIPKLKKRIFVTCNHYEICTIFSASKDDLLENAFGNCTHDAEIEDEVF